MKIENTTLTEEHNGSKVTYVPRHVNGNAAHKDCEGGTIKRFTEHTIFVEYGTGTAKSTPPELLVWG